MATFLFFCFLDSVGEDRLYTGVMTLSWNTRSQRTATAVKLTAALTLLAAGALIPGAEFGAADRSRYTSQSWTHTSPSTVTQTKGKPSQKQTIQRNDSSIDPSSHPKQGPLYTSNKSEHETISQEQLNEQHVETSIPLCSRILLFTGPRHGSTWFLNNAERCRYSLGDGTFGALHDESELWVPRDESSVLNISLPAAQQWLLHNTSLKIFPWVWRTRQNDVEKLINFSKNHQIPFVLLRRNVTKAFESIVVAQRTKEWNRNAYASVEEIDDRDHVMTTLSPKEEIQWKQFRKFIETSMDSMANFFRVHRIPIDEFFYDDVVSKPSVSLYHARTPCVIRNCNVLQK